MDARNLIRRAMVTSWLAALALAAPADRSLAGETWEYLGLAEGEFINLATDGTYLYAVANDYTASGIFRRYLDHPDSSWVELSGLEGETLFAVWASPVQPGVVFVGNEAPFVTPGAADLYRSDDAGMTWTASDAGIVTDTTDSPGVILIAGSPFDPDQLLVWADTLFRSEDGGVTWSCGEYFGCSSLFGGPTAGITFDPFAAGRVWLPTNTGFEIYFLYRSDDDGVSWSSEQTSYWTGDLAVSGISGRMYRTSGSVLSTSTDDGESFETVFDTGGGWLRAIGPSPWNDDDIVLGQQRADEGERLGWISRDAGATWLPFDAGLPDSVEAITQLLPDPARVGVYYAATGPDSQGNGLHGAVWRVQLESVVDVAGDAPGGARPRLVVRANPAHRTATFELGAGVAALAGDVRIFDTSGRHAGTARRVGSRGAGTFRWDGRDATGGVAAPGTYFAIHERSGSTARFVWLGR